MIEPVAAALRIDTVTNVFANSLLFDTTTRDFCGYDDAEPTAAAGGKAAVVIQLKARHKFRMVVMIGDGATDRLLSLDDLEAREAPGGADAFIGFGGHSVREKVRGSADWFVMSFQELRQAMLWQFLRTSVTDPRLIFKIRNRRSESGGSPITVVEMVHSTLCHTNSPAVSCA